ncbi:MAG TPA: hypothetical protein VH833_08590 [Gemmatimonadales bacterium]|jgi:hypothetical protein
MMLLTVLLALQQPVAPPAAADSSRGRPCLLVVDTVGHEGRQVEVGPGLQNIYAGGGVRAHCQGTTTTLASDSMVWNAITNRLDLLGTVRIRDTSLTLDANLANYYRLDERLEAHNNVVAVNRNNGSVLRGPNLVYWRAAPGIRDTVEMYATQRPTIQYRGAGAADTTEPYVIIADRVRFKGNDRMWAGGKSTIDRSDFGAQSDSMALDQIAGVGVLIGSPRVQGKGAQSYTLTGTRIELGLQARDVRLVKALGDGKATSTEWTLAADTIHLAIERRKLQQAFAWGTTVRPHAVSALQDIRADSLALDVPDQVLTEGRGFGRAFSASKRDSTVAAVRVDCASDTADCLVSCVVVAVDCIAGDTLTARWAQERDSAGAQRSRIHQIIARGSARALSHLPSRDSTTGPALNYSRGKSIDILLRQARIDRVTVGGRADGVHLEPRPPAPPDTTAQRDST